MLILPISIPDSVALCLPKDKVQDIILEFPTYLSVVPNMANSTAGTLPWLLQWIILLTISSVQIRKRSFVAIAL